MLRMIHRSKLKKMLLLTKAKSLLKKVLSLTLLTKVRVSKRTKLP